FREVRLLRIARGAVARKARRDDRMRAAAQQLEPRLVADLHAAARQQCDAAFQIRELGPLPIIQLRARRTKLIVEVMNLRELRLAHVAMLPLLGFGVWDLACPERSRGGFGIFQKIIWRREDGLAAQRTNARLVQDAVVFFLARIAFLARLGLEPPAPYAIVRVVRQVDRTQQ